MLCHALESYTALPYAQRTPRPARPELRPAYQGANPISDVWALQALRVIGRAFERAARGERAARERMALASTYAGIGFGNAGARAPGARGGLEAPRARGHLSGGGARGPRARARGRGARD